MNVYIGWAGTIGRKLAAILKNWLRRMLPELHFNDQSELSPGMEWLPELRSQLINADFGVFCLTKESLESTYLAYEIGMLDQKKPHIPVILFLFGVNPAEVLGPLRYYQCVSANETGIRSLTEALWNAAMDNRVAMPNSFGLNARIELMSSSFQEDLDALRKEEKEREVPASQQERTVAEINDISKKLDVILSALALSSDSSAELASENHADWSQPS